MPIPVVCSGCQKKIQAPDRVAGKRVKCPQCATVITIPSAAAASSPSVKAAPAKSWFLKTPDGNDYGPVPKPELDKWFKEGRITAHSQLLEDGASAWQWATEVYPSLAESKPPARQAPAQQGSGPPVRVKSASQQTADPFAITTAEEPVAQATPGVRRRRRRQSGNVNLVGVTLFLLAFIIVAQYLIFLAVSGAWELADRFPGARSRLMGHMTGRFGIAALYAFTGMGVMNRKEWARILTLILMALVTIGGGRRLFYAIEMLVRGKHFREYFFGENATLLASIDLILGLFIVGSAIFAYVTLLNKRYASEFETAGERE